MTGEQVLDLLLTLLSPLWVNGEVDEHPACLFGQCQLVACEPHRLSRHTDDTSVDDAGEKRRHDELILDQTSQNYTRARLTPTII